MPLKTLVSLINEAASRVDPGKHAVAHGNGSISYEQLLDGAQGIGSTLAASGVCRGDRVALWMDKTPNCVQAILGILMCGAAYVPIDPKAPWRRARIILQDSGASALLVDQTKLANLACVLDDFPINLLIIDGEKSAEVRFTYAKQTVEINDAIESEHNLPCSPEAEDLAYILYTSGSTGTPKGVAHTHQSGLGFVRWVQDRFAIRPDDVFSSHAPFHFDLSICDLYASLGSGATVHLISSMEAMLAPYLVKNVPKWGITVWYSTPSILMSMMEQGDLEAQGFGNVRFLFFAGEVFPTPQLLRLRKALPAVRMFNLFGPTETNVCTYYEVPGVADLDPDKPISIGRGCENLETFVIGECGEEVCTEGQDGILWAKGDNIMSGYWNNSDRTAEMLFEDPRGNGGIACRTGDRVQIQYDGNYEFLGRIDHLVKIRGFRVELGEIESVLASHPDVLEAIAVPLPDEKIGNRLVATVVARVAKRLDSKALRAHCGNHLPSYMIPERIDVTDSLPLTSTGKTDRKTLEAQWLAKETQ